MSGGSGAWASGLGIPEDAAARFDAIARAFDLSAADRVGMPVARVAEADAALHRAALFGLSHWRTKESFTNPIVLTDLEALPADVRPTGSMWSSDRPFPWTAEECKAAVLGYEVGWRGTNDDLFMHVRGKRELSDGYAVLHQV